jgi:hypothetical protein
MHRIIGLIALVLSAAPCLAQVGNQNQAPGSMVPAPGALPASPQFSPSGNMPAPLPPLIDNPLRGLQDPPDPGRFSPQVRAWASMRAAGLARVGEIPDAEEMPGYLRKAGFGILGDMNDGDIMALAFIVMMEAAKSAQEDLKSIMAKVKAINNAKQKSRELLSKINERKGGQKKDGASPCLVVDCNAASSALAHAAGLRGNARGYQLPANPTWADIMATADHLSKGLDSLSELGELESLRLQMAMDRLSKMMHALSNLLKKRSDTESSIADNQK